MLPKTISTKFAHYSILILLAILLLVMALLFDREQIHHYRDQVYSETERQLHSVHASLNANLQSHIQAVRGLPGLFAVNPHLTQEQFAKGVRHLIRGDSEIRNIAAAPDMVIRYMYPMAGNEKAIGLNYRQQPDQFEAADRARRTKKLVLAGPLKLVQGGDGMITRIPVFIPDEQGKEYFWGLISAVIDLQQFFIKSGLETDQLPIKLAIRGKDSLGRQGDVFFGDPKLFNHPRLTQRLGLPEGEWLLTAEPLQGWDKLPANIWQKRALLLGGALILFALFAMFFRFIFEASMANNKFRHLIESSPVPYLLWNQQEVTYVNKAFTAAYGFSKEELNAMKNWLDITGDAKEYQKNFENLISTDNASSMEIRIHCRNGHTKSALMSVSSLFNTLGNEVLILLHDITVRKEAEEQLRFSSRVFNQAQEGILITAIDGSITDVNPAFCEITGYSREEVIGQLPNLLKSGKHSPEFYVKLWRSVIEHGYWQGEIWNRRKNGELYAELLTISALVDDDGEIRHFVGLFSDITQTKKQQETLELMAHYDVLTKLPNRVLFADRFTQALAHSHRNKNLLAICFLDLDGFKPVNDRLGHESGDLLLVEVAARLRASVRDEDTISRFGGDEFAIIFRDIDSEAQCEQLLQRIHESIAQPYHLNEQVITISASSGVTFYPKDDADLDTLLRHADQTMYQAKLAGRNSYKLFNPKLNQQTLEKQHWLEQIREGLENNEFRLFFQPKVNMRTGQVFGMEALIRWQHPEQGLLAPAAFLPSISGTRLEIEIGKWVLQEALIQLDLWHQQGFNIEVSVNISSSHLQSDNFIKDVDTALAKHPDIHSRFLQLEVLETSALGDITAVAKIIKLSRDMLGVSVALDDFGTGYSSLTHLRHLTASTIKIDQSFVRDMLNDPQDFTIVDGITGLAESFNREVIAEGVETQEHGLLLLLVGCERAQGYGIAKPMPADDVVNWLIQYEPNEKWMTLGSESLTERQRALRIFNITFQRWYDLFIESVMLPIEKVQHWPILAHKKCHCGSWINRVASQNLFNAIWLSRLEQEHEKYHLLAQEIHDIYITDKPELARKKLDKFRTIFIEIQNMLKAEALPESLSAKTLSSPNLLHDESSER